MLGEKQKIVKVHKIGVNTFLIGDKDECILFNGTYEAAVNKAKKLCSQRK